MYLDCDHLKDDTSIFTIRGNWDSNSQILLAKPVYIKTGEKYIKIVDKQGDIGENLVWINPNQYTHIKCRGINKKDYLGNSIWDRMVQQFLTLGINENDIGLFGSKRLGLPNCKDYDFILYGRNNMELLKNNIDFFKTSTGLFNHSIAHAKYQAETHGKYFKSSKQDLLLALLNKWSTCSFNPTQTTTIRFVDINDKSGDLLKSILYNKKLENIITVSGIVKNAENTSFMPRRFTLVSDEKEYEIIIPLWLYHQCVKNNDYVEVTGCEQNNIIVVRRYCDGIKFL